MAGEDIVQPLNRCEPVDIAKLHPAGLHVCLIYDDEEERREVVYRFIEAGLKAGERVSYFTEKMDPAEVQAWLEARGITTPQPGQFDVLPARDVYCPDGHFSIEPVLEKWRRFERDTLAAGFSAARATGETNWSRVVPGGEMVAQYCARLNQALAGSPVGALCQYDANYFDGAALFEVLRVHPLMIVGTQVVNNPYYVGPQGSLRENDPGS